MQKYKKAALSIAFLTLLISGGITNGYIRPELYVENNKDYTQEESLLETFEKSDYEAWKKIVSRKSKLDQLVDKNEFEQFITARQLTRSGEYDKAIAIANKLEIELKEKLSYS